MSHQIDTSKKKSYHKYSDDSSSSFSIGVKRANNSPQQIDIFEERNKKRGSKMIKVSESEYSKEEIDVLNSQIEADDSDDESLDFTYSQFKTIGGKALIRTTLKQYLIDKSLYIHEKRPLTTLSHIIADFKFGRRVMEYVYKWIRNQKFTKKVVVEEPLFIVDPIIQKLFTQPGYIKPQHVNILTSALEKVIPPHIRQVYYDDEIKVIKEKIKAKESLGTISNLVEQLPLTVQIQSILLIAKENSLKETRQNLFDNIFSKVLKQEQHFKALTKMEIDQIYDLVKDLDLSTNLTQQSAVKLFTILHTGRIKDYDLIRKNCSHLNNVFWEEIFNLFEIKGEFKDLMTKYKMTLFTNVIKNHIDKYLLNMGFMQTLAKMELLTADQVAELDDHYRRINYNNVLFKFIKETITFNDYLNKVKMFVLFTGDLNDQVTKVLANNPVYKWDQYHQLLKSSLTETHNALELVKKEIQHCFNEIVKSKPPTQTNMKIYLEKLTKEYKVLSHKFPSLIKLEWQEHLICSLYHLIYLDKTAIQIRIPTGHGKSIIIQLLSQMI